MTSTSTETIIAQTTTYVTELIKNNILPKVVKYVNSNRDREITIEEIEQMLSIQTGKQTSNKKCIWIFKRGKLSGQTCDKPTIAGIDYCSYCSKRPCFKPNQNTVGPTNVISADQVPKSGCYIPTIDIIAYNEEHQLYIDVINNYVIKKFIEDEQNFTVIGKADDSDERLVTRLTLEEVSKATNDGFVVDEDYDYTDFPEFTGY